MATSIGVSSKMAYQKVTGHSFGHLEKSTRERSRKVITTATEYKQNLMDKYIMENSVIDSDRGLGT